MYFIKSVIAALFAGSILAFPAGAVLYILKAVFYLPFVRNKRFRSAKRVEALLDHRSVRHGTDDVVSLYYSYRVDGIEYRYRYEAQENRVQNRLFLYYMPDDPAHAETELRFTGENGLFRKCYLLSMLIIVPLLIYAFLRMKR